MTIIIGLGNVGSRYARTRHNVGFMVVDALAAEYGATFKPEPKLKSDVATIEHDGRRVILVKPQTMMNLSGEAAQRVMQFYKAPLETVWAVYDDVDTDFGKARTRTAGSSGGHQGVKSLQQHIGEGFLRLRVGISLNDRTVEPSEVYVLKPFDDGEQAALPQVITACVSHLQTWLDQGSRPTDSTIDLLASRGDQ